MDIRNPVLAILCGGAPAPGINGVISSITIEALNSNCSVLGIFEGFKQLKAGKSMVLNIEFNDVTRLYSTGGSLIRTSKQQLDTPAHVDNCLRVLQHHRVRYLVTIGGTQTAYSASLVVSAAAAAKYNLSVVHVPKSIFSDLPLGEGVRTFGFSTAREVGCQLVQNFMNDARTMLRWYILVCMGQKAGHLTLGIGKAGAATLTILAEDYIGRATPLTFMELATVLEAAIYKRRAMNKEYGVACISEGLVSCFDQKELIERFGDLDTAHMELGRHLRIELVRRFEKRSPPIDQTVVARNIGNELRSAPPNASDITLTRDLGFAATRVLMEGGNSCLVTLRGGVIHTIPFSAILDTAHASTQIRLVDTTSLSYQVAQSYSIMLRQPDLQDTGFLQKLARAANMTASDFLLQFQSIAAPMASFRQPQEAGISYAFMNNAFAHVHLDPTAASSGSAQLTQQTREQLSLPSPSATQIVQPGQAPRKSSDREVNSASPPTHLQASQAQPLQIGRVGVNLGDPGRGGGMGADFASTLIHSSAVHSTALLSQGAASQQLFSSSSALGAQSALLRISASSPTPLHLLTNPETPQTVTSAGTPRQAFLPFPTPSHLAQLQQQHQQQHQLTVASPANQLSSLSAPPPSVNSSTGSTLASGLAASLAATPKQSPLPGHGRRPSFEFRL